MLLDNFFTLSEECLLFLYSVLLGVFLGVVFDIFRIIRAIIPHKSALVAVEDVIFMMIWGLSLVIFSVELSRGNVRFFCFLGSVLGFAIYFFTVGYALLTAIRAVSNAIRRFFYLVYRKILLKIAGGFVSVYQKVKTFFVNNCPKFKKI